MHDYGAYGGAVFRFLLLPFRQFRSNNSRLCRLFLFRYITWQNQASFCFLIGSSRMRLPVAA